MELRDFDKPPLSVAGQAQRLLEKGLVSDCERLERYLRTIGYYRFSIYWKPYLITDTKKFRDGTTLDDVLSVYIFDRKLRLTIMEAIERIEISLRSQWSGMLALHGGGVSAYTDAKLFKKYHKKHKFNHAESLGKIKITIKKNEERFIKHHRDNYTNSDEPPIWAVAQIMTLGELSIWVNGTIEPNTRAEIRSMFCIKDDAGIEAVFYAISNIRNICAHHSGLWNRIIKISLPNDLQNSISAELCTYKDKSNQIKVDSHLYNHLVVIEHLLRAINSNSDWKSRLVELLETMDYSHHKQMGFPIDWKLREPWRSVLEGITDKKKCICDG